MGNLVGLRSELRKVDDLTTVVDLHGELDTHTAPRARTAMLSLLDEGCRHLILNLRWMDFIDSTGLSVLMGALRNVRELGGSIRLVAPVYHVRRIFEVTRLTYAFPIDATEKESLAQVPPPASA